MDVAVVGAGFGGLAAAHALSLSGLRFRIFEKAASVGGTWRDNRYPGVACDVPAHLYSLSHAPNPHWSRLFASGGEILSHMRNDAERFSDRIAFGHRLICAVWRRQCWQLTFDNGAQIEARHVIAAMGGLHVPNWPALPGLEAFAGPAFHSARWPADFRAHGLRVGVIGTGASAIQFVPELAKVAAELHVFQRTPPWVIPRPDFGFGSGLQRAFAALPMLRLALRGATFLTLEMLGSGLRYPSLAFWARALGRSALRSIEDPVKRAQLTPDYPIGCKRVLISSDYYPALNRPNVHLHTAPVRAVAATGVELDARVIALDALVFGTGFKPMDVLSEVDIVGPHGRLAEHWSERPGAYFGVSVPGFPNWHFLLGPNSALGHNSVLTIIEAQVAHALRLIEHAGGGSIEVEAPALQAFLSENDAALATSAWSGCQSWYLDERGRNIALWTSSVSRFRRRLRRVGASGYRTR